MKKAKLNTACLALGILAFSANASDLSSIGQLESAKLETTSIKVDDPGDRGTGTGYLISGHSDDRGTGTGLLAGHSDERGTGSGRLSRLLNQLKGLLA